MSSNITKTGINADTSVLFNYLYSTLLPLELEDDRECRRLFESDAFRVVAGGKAGQEFARGCDRRHEIYDDIVEYMETTGQEIFEYEPERRSVHTSNNDLNHIRKQLKWNSEILDADPAKQLSLVRKVYQQFDSAAQELLRDELDNVHQQFSHPGLRNQFQTELDINHDCDILVDAVFLCKDESIELLVAVDSDITKKEHRDQVHEIVKDELGKEVPLTIIDPQTDDDGHLDP